MIDKMKNEDIYYMRTACPTASSAVVSTALAAMTRRVHRATSKDRLLVVVPPVSAVVVDEVAAVVVHEHGQVLVLLVLAPAV